MREVKRALPVLMVSVLLAAVLFWVGGCDFSRIDDGAEAPLEVLVEELAEAETAVEAEQQSRHRRARSPGRGARPVRLLPAQ